jgi:hypothetical protein
MVRKMAQASGRGRVLSMPLRVWSTRAAAVVVAAGAGWLAWEQWVVSDPARLIAEARKAFSPEARAALATVAGDLRSHEQQLRHFGKT